jgi:hypothetical protein
MEDELELAAEEAYLAEEDQEAGGEADMGNAGPPATMQDLERK